MPEAAEDAKPLSAAKPRSNVYSVLLVLAAVVYAVALALVIAELQDTHNFGKALFGDAKYPQ